MDTCKITMKKLLEWYGLNEVYCFLCGRNDDNVSYDREHKMTRGSRADLINDPSNIIPLCHPCHMNRNITWRYSDDYKYFQIWKNYVRTYDIPVPTRQTILNHKNRELK